MIPGDDINPGYNMVHGDIFIPRDNIILGDDIS